jgi:TRAP-type C4-dicarboxylate transport system permease small subunit
MGKIEKVISYIIEKSGFLGAFALLFMVLFTTIDIVLRIFKHPIKGSMEVTVVLMACIVFFALGICTLQDSHIKVDIFKKGRFFDTFNYIVAVVLGLLIGIQTYKQAIISKAMNIGSQMLHIPRYPFMIIAAYGFFLLSLAAIILLYKHIRGGAEREDIE